MIHVRARPDTHTHTHDTNAHALEKCLHAAAAAAAIVVWYLNTINHLEIGNYTLCSHCA